MSESSRNSRMDRVERYLELLAQSQAKITQLASAQLLTEEKLQGLIDSLRRGGNGQR
jgi:hypothetical protein